MNTVIKIKGLNLKIFDVPRSAFCVPSPVWNFVASVTGQGTIHLERVPGFTHRGNRKRGPTYGPCGITVRDRRNSGANISNEDYVTA